MTKVQTFLFGEVEVDPERIIKFPEGLIAFENNKRFMLIHEMDKGAPTTFTLQSLDDPHVAFQIIDPCAVGFEYELALTAEESSALQSPDPKDVAVMQIVFKRDEGAAGDFATNYRAPLIINTKARVAIQKVISSPRPNLTISNLANSF